jgi:GNAT superfamily N-acetyltransferase
MDFLSNRRRTRAERACFGSPSSSRGRDIEVAQSHAWRWAATPPKGIVFAREEGRITVAEFQEVIRLSRLNRPVNDPGRLAAMLSNANLLVTARDGAGVLVGLARSLTDFAYCCYLSDLCVIEAWQSRGIGRALLAETKRIVGPGCTLLLVSAPTTMSYYPHIGLEPVVNGFLICRVG